MAAQIYAGLSGITQDLLAPVATESPYADGAQVQRIASNLQDALAAFQSDRAMCEGFGQAFVRHYACLKHAERERYEAAQDKDEFQRREYFSRI